MKNIQWKSSLHLLMVQLPAVHPDLSLVPSERGDVAHLHHGPGEMLEEELVVRRVELNQVHRRRVVGEEDLVGAEEARLGHQVPEVGVVELGGADEVQGEEVLVAAGARASRPQMSCVGRVEGEVREPLPGLVVQPLPETGASR